MPEENWLNDSVFTIPHLFTPAECEDYIRLSEEIGYEDALLTSPQGNVLRTDIRNNDRVMYSAEEENGEYEDAEEEFGMDEDVEW